MEKKMMAWKTKGMNRDLSVSAFNPEFSFENMNLRLATNEGNTMLSWVNEKGTRKITSIDIDTTPWKAEEQKIKENEIKGLPVGSAVINNTLVLFTQKENDSPTKKDRIYKLWYENGNIEGVLLFRGNLEFSLAHPLETLVSYEAEDVQKVYWTDGEKQPRVINIAKTIPNAATYNDFSFDFIRKLALSEEVHILKEFGSSGAFPPGVIQYAFTYYNKYGQESNIFYTSPLLYISHRDRGASPDDSSVDNVFKITVTGVDHSFDYLRIYSIQRTSLNGVPICKRVQDIAVKSDSVLQVNFTDTGTVGETIDPTELLYKGGESIKVQTMVQKDGTLFFGNLTVEETVIDAAIRDAIVENTTLQTDYRTFYPEPSLSGDYIYYNQLSSHDGGAGVNKDTVPCGGFKYGDYYRCGIQFQHETGKWSDPIYIDDVQIKDAATPGGGYISKRPVVEGNKVKVPVIKGTLEGTNNTIMSDLRSAGFRKARAVVVFPSFYDRVSICQGVGCPTMYTDEHRTYPDPDIEGNTLGKDDLYAQASWFFRPTLSSRTVGEDIVYDAIDDTTGAVTPFYIKNNNYDNILKYTSNEVDWTSLPTYSGYNPKEIRLVEIQGVFADEKKFKVSADVSTLHSPDLVFEDNYQTFSWNNLKTRHVGYAQFTKTLSDINIQTESPAIAGEGAGFVKADSSVFDDSFGLGAGLFYSDYIVDDYNNEPYSKALREKSNSRWLVYPWHKNGSLNNDTGRPANCGTQSAILKKKIISNLRFADTIWDISATTGNDSKNFKLFAQTEIGIEKIEVGNEYKNYQGNIDTLLSPDEAEGFYFAHEDPLFGEDNTGFTSTAWRKTYTHKDPYSDQHAIWKNTDGIWTVENNTYDIGDCDTNVTKQSTPVRMKYKSTPHLVGLFDSSETTNAGGSPAKDLVLPIYDIIRPGDNPSDPTDPDYRGTMFGGTTDDAKKANIWIPCGEPVVIPQNSNLYFEYSYGDTYFQRWDCMKTYPFTPEDVNQIVEIGSFMLETRVNIDGRYDRNRGQVNNTTMSPLNFNLLNPVYSQQNNFFSYKIKDEDDYGRKIYPNQITWSKTKTSGADVDAWTSVTLASTLELDGDKGALRKLERLNDSIIAFQDKGISQILYNENVQIQSTEGVPIELANSGKVQGKRYISNTIGCSNKWSVCNTPLGIYFIDSNEKSIYLFNGELSNLSMSKGMNTWIKKNAPSFQNGWTPDTVNGFKDFVSCYDQKNQDVLFINKEVALAFSEKMGAFTSFYDYGNTPYFCNLGDEGFWIQPDNTNIVTSIWEHQAGGYCTFFDTVKPYWMTLVGNPEPLLDKTFTNLEFRACVTGDGSSRLDEEIPVFDKFYLPFDSLEVWDEYQHGMAALSIKNGGMGDGKHHLPNTSNASLNRKFRIWRCDVPRDNAQVDSTAEASMGITRFKVRPLDRMRNPWIYLKLMKEVEEEEQNQQTIQFPMHKVEVHDMVMSYYI